MTNGSIGIYNGLGKQILLENDPTTWGGGITMTFSPKGNVPQLFGGLTRHSSLPWKPMFQLSSSHLGEIDLTTKGGFKLKRTNNFYQINGYLFNHRKDGDDGNFMDLPLKKWLFLTHKTNFNRGNYQGNLELFYLKKVEQGGELNFDKKMVENNKFSTIPPLKNPKIANPDASGSTSQSSI